MIPTAQQIFYKMLEQNDECTFTEMMIEFAKLHVKEALKQASENVEIIYTSESYTDYEADKETIINAYDLNNIK